MSCQTLQNISYIYICYTVVILQFYNISINFHFFLLSIHHHNILGRKTYHSHLHVLLTSNWYPCYTHLIRANCITLHSYTYVAFCFLRQMSRILNTLPSGRRVSTEDMFKISHNFYSSKCQNCLILSPFLESPLEMQSKEYKHA